MPEQQQTNIAEWPAHERLAWKVRTFGDAAALETDEVMAYLSVSSTQLERLRASLPWSDAAGVRSPRLLFGSLVAWVKQHEQPFAA